MKSLKYILLIFIFSCSNILYNHNDAMSMLVSKDLVLERFGTPTDIIEGRSEERRVGKECER